LSCCEGNSMKRIVRSARRIPDPSVRYLIRLIAGAATVGLIGLLPVQLGVVGAGLPADAASSDACGTVTFKSDGTPWACSYVDNFDGRSLDPTKWITQQTSLTGFRTGQTCYTASSQNIKVARGELYLTARREWGSFVCKNPLGDFTTSYTGGMIGTRGKFSQAYGKFEVRAKFPNVTTPGLHGGFAMFPVDRIYGPWPASGEIDVAEWWSVNSTLVLPSLHFNGRDHLVDTGWNCRVTTPSSYHTYTVLWLPTEISFFVDGTMCFTRMPTPDSPLVAPQPFDQPFTMVLGMGVGTASGTNAVTWKTPLPATFRVDYAKAWH